MSAAATNAATIPAEPTSGEASTSGAVDTAPPEGDAAGKNGATIISAASSEGQQHDTSDTNDLNQTGEDITAVEQEPRVQTEADTAPAPAAAAVTSAGGGGSSHGVPSSTTQAAAPASGGSFIGGAIAIVKQKSKITKNSTPAEAIYMQDINFSTIGGMATAADIMVKQARTRVRINRLKEGQAKGRHTVPDEKGDRKRVELTIRMMLGVRVAVGRQSNPLASQEVMDEDFAQVDKYVFPPAGATGRLPTPSHKLNKTFKFRDYAPKAFKKLREHFGIEEWSYMLSVAGNYDYLELITNSKSGSFFFYSHDQRYIIKAMKKSEAKFFRKILQLYYEHHLSHPDSMMIQFCGMYMVKHRHKKIPFIVMKCVEGETKKKIDSKYDLKGSSLGRSAKPGEKVLKDNDLAENLGKIHLGTQRAAFIRVAREDAEFLASVNVMDYSMLTSVHDSSVQPEGDERRTTLERRYSNFYTFADEATDRTTPAFERLSASTEVEEGKRGDAVSAENESGDADPERPAGRTSVSRNTSTLRYREDGGVESEANGVPGKEIYFMGIIDILQQYNTRKHIETFWKSFSHDRYEISCVDPKTYCERFVEFLEKHTD